MSASINLDIDATKQEDSSSSSTSIGSNLSASNIKIKAENKAELKGSNLNASEAIEIDANKVNILAGTNAKKDKSSTENIHLSISMGTSGPGVNANVSASKSESSNQSTNYNNTNLNADNINITSKEDTNVIGASVRAENRLALDIGGDLNVESVQNTNTSRSSSIGVSGGSEGKSSEGKSSGSGGANAGFRRSKEKNTVITSLTGSQVEINVANNLDIVGAKIASTNKVNGEAREGTLGYESGHDNGNLEINTSSLTFANLSNTKTSNSASIGGNGGGSNASGNFAMGRENSKTKILATIGSGALNITDETNSDDQSRLNRDIDNQAKKIYDVKSDVSIKAEVDIRLLSEDGRKDIKEDIERSKRLGEALVDVATKESITLLDTFNHIGDVQKDLDVQKALALKNNGKLLDILDDKSRDKYTIEEKDKALNDYAQIYADAYGISIEEAKSVATKKYRGMTYTNKEGTNSNIYIDDNNNNSALDTAKTMGHEVAHARQNQGQTRQRATKELQEEYADTFGDYSSEGMQFSSATYANVNLNNNKPIIPRKARSQSDIKRLNTNTNELIKDVDKASGGNGRVDPMMSAGAYEAIELDAKNGNKASQLFLELAKENPDPKIINKLKEQLPPEAVKQVMEISEEERNSIIVEKDIAQAIVEIAKVVVGVDDLKDAVATILEDKFLDAAISTAMLIAKPLKGFKYVDDVTLLLDKTGDKVVEFAGKFYGKSKKGELVEIEVASAKRDSDTIVLGKTKNPNYGDFAKKEGARNFSIPEKNMERNESW